MLLEETMEEKAQRRHEKEERKKETSHARKRLFYSITILLPFLCVGLLELALRFVHYGPDLSLLSVEVFNGRTYHVMNPGVKNRYFSHVDFNPSTSPDYFILPKPTGTFRIFCLGGSTTVGYPYWYNGSFSTFLRDRLRKIFPERKIEIINLGMTATNSFSVLDIARELVDFEPDLFIVYDGHNEFYGALGIASHESLGASRWIITTYLKLIHFRTFLMMRDAYTGIVGLFTGHSAPEPSGTMMEKLARGQYIPYGSKAYLSCLSNFRSNLEDLRNLCAAHKIPVIAASQVSNLRGMAPFVSGDHPGGTPEARMAFSDKFNRGLTEAMDSNFEAALATFSGVLALDSVHAETHFQIARCLDSLNRKSDARVEYIKARDYDQLRFRASTDFNTAIRRTADGKDFMFLDMERAFQDQSPDSLIGNELIVEHLHPNSRGYFLMAKEYAEMMREHQLLASAGEWSRDDTLTDAQLWEARSLTDLDERTAKRRTDILISGWPFKEQFPTVDAVSEQDTIGQIVEKVTRAKWNWVEAHNAAAEYYLGRGEWDKAEKEYLTLTNQLPLIDVQPYLKLARLYLDQARYSEARSQLLESIPIKPTILAYRALGDLSLNMGSSKEAITFYEKTFTFDQSLPERVENGYLLALALLRANMPGQAVARLHEILKIKPDYKPAVDLLARIQASR